MPPNIETSQACEYLTSLFTDDTPQRALHYRPHELRRTVDGPEEQALHRDWATAQLVGLAVMGETLFVEEVLGRISDVKPDVAFGLGVNILRKTEVADSSSASKALKVWLENLLEADETGIFTVHDKHWLEGVDLDYIDEESLLLELCEAESPKPKKATLFRPKPQVAQPSVWPLAHEGLATYDKLPRNTANNTAHDRMLAAIAKEYFRNAEFSAVISLLDKRKLRTDIWEKHLGLLHDKAVHQEACRRLRITEGGSVETARAYIETVMPWTAEGLELIEAFRARITKDT